MCIVTSFTCRKSPSKDAVSYQVSVLKLFNITYLSDHLTGKIEHGLKEMRSEHETFNLKFAKVRGILMDYFLTRYFALPFWHPKLILNQ